MTDLVERMKRAEDEARRFLKTIPDVRKRFKEDKYAEFGCKETAAMKRASMDLTRALADLRK